MWVAGRELQSLKSKSSSVFAKSSTVTSSLWFMCVIRMSHFLDWKEHFPWTWFWLQFHTIPPIPSPPNHIWQRKLAAYKCILWEIRSFCPHFPIFAIPFIFYLLSNLFFFKLSPLLVFSYPHNCLLIFLLLSPLLPLPRLLALHDQCKSLIKTLRSQRISWGFVFDSVCVWVCVQDRTCGMQGHAILRPPDTVIDTHT